MSNTLRAPSSINDLRTQAHLQLSARLQNLDITPLLIYTLGANIPESIIPYMIWQLDMMIPAVPMQALGVSPTAIIQAALPLHSISGTKAAILQALALCGFTTVDVQEGQASWGGTTYPANEGWAVFRIDLGGSAQGQLFSQAPDGFVDGTNRTFNLPGEPVANSLRMFYNGLLFTGYSQSGSSVVLDFTPVDEEIIGCVLRTFPVSSTTLALLTTVVNFFKPARCLLDSIQSESSMFFDGVVLTPSGRTLTLPEVPTSVELYRNGLYQTQSSDTEVRDFTLSGATITPTNAPIAGDIWLAWGVYGTSGSAPTFVDAITPTGIINGSNATFTLPSIPNPAASLRLYLGDPGAAMLAQQGQDYMLASNVITYTNPPASGSGHLAFYRT